MKLSIIKMCYALYTSVDTSEEENIYLVCNAIRYILLSAGIIIPYRFDLEHEINTKSNETFSNFQEWMEEYLDWTFYKEPVILEGGPY